MATYRKRYEHWVETKRIVMVDGEPVVKQVTCCCTAPAATARQCADSRQLKTRCRCFCHSPRIFTPKQN